MNRLEFTTEIKADKVTIWKALWSDDLYRQWAGVFFEGSFVVAKDWEEGSKVHFLGSDKNGIYSRIEKHMPNEYIAFKHIGNVLNGEEQVVDKETEKWSGATEIYKIVEERDCHKLMVEIDVMDEHVVFMSKSFPKALEVIKSNCVSS